MHNIKLIWAGAMRIQRKGCTIVEGGQIYEKNDMETELVNSSQVHKIDLDRRFLFHTKDQGSPFNINRAPAQYSHASATACNNPARD